MTLLSLPYRAFLLYIHCGVSISPVEFAIYHVSWRYGSFPDEMMRNDDDDEFGGDLPLLSDDDDGDTHACVLVAR
jgi:hypothetical protein